VTQATARMAAIALPPAITRTKATKWTLAKVVKPATACRVVNFSRGTINIRDDSSSGDNRNIMDVNSSKTRISRKVRQQQRSPQQGCQQHQGQ
jgi:hypothetical protein